MQRITSSAYEWHNYAKSTIGNRSDIERVPVVRLRQFYRKFYRPDNVMVVVAGKFDEKNALQYLQKYFGALDSPDTPIDETYTTEPPQDGERTVVLRRVGDVQYMGAAYHIPSGSHPDFAACRILQYILGDEPSGRLYQKLVKTKIASSASGFCFAFHDPGLFMTLAEVPKDNSILAAQEALLGVMEDSFKMSEITDKEVERARQNVLKSREDEAKNSDRIAISLSEWAAQGDWRLYFLFRDRIENIRTEEVQAVAEKYFVRNNRTLGLYLPSEKAERVDIPESPDLIAALDGYKGREVTDVGEAFDPSPDAIEKRITRTGLPGGMKALFLPKKSRGGNVAVRFALRFGDVESLKGKSTASQMLGTLMSRGTETKSYQDIQDELTRMRANMSFSSQAGLLRIVVSTKQQFLPEVLDLVKDVLRNPKLDSSELEILREQAITGIESQLNEPNAKAPMAVRKALSPYSADDVRYTPGMDEQLQRLKDLTINDVREIHQQFIGNSAGQVSVIGNFEAEVVKEKLEEVLDGFTAEKTYTRIDQPAVTDVDGRVIAIETPDKANALYFASMQLNVDDGDDDYPALAIGNFILGSSGLSSRLGDRVRQKEGLSY
ncbi:MAG: insulinase family protein, partial [Planctomycetota bacterium]